MTNENLDISPEEHLGKVIRADLTRRRSEQRSLSLSDADAVNLGCAVNGIHVVPRTPTDHEPIVALIWPTAAVAADGSGIARKIDGHPAEHGDGGGLLVDSAVLTPIVRRHFLPEPQPGWTDHEFAREFHLETQQPSHTQALLQS